MDRDTIVELHRQAAEYHKLASAKYGETLSRDALIAEYTWYDVCCWLYVRMGEANEKV